jgi:general secretion pathway protein J
MQKNNKTFRSLGAFTLLELIVAMALMDVIAVALYSSMYTAFNAKEKSRDSLKPFETVTPAFEYIRKDLVSAMQPDGILAGVFVGESHPGQNDLDADTMSFYTCSYQPADNEIASNVVHIEYALDADPDQDQMVLKRLIIKNTLSPTALDPREEIVGRNISGLDLQYYDGSTWVDEWDSSVENAQLPWAVKVTLTIYDPESNRSSEQGMRDFTQIFMLLSANQEKNDQDTGEMSQNG